MTPDDSNPYREVRCAYCNQTSLALHTIACELKPGALTNLGKKDVIHVHADCLPLLKKRLAHASQS